MVLSTIVERAFSREITRATTALDQARQDRERTAQLIARRDLFVQQLDDAVKAATRP